MLYTLHSNVNVNKWKQSKTSLLLVYFVLVLAILGARWFTEPQNRTLCTTNVHVGTELHCEPWFACSLSKIKYYAPPNTDKNCLFFACSLWTTKKWKVLPWCTKQLGGAQHKSVVHNVVMYPRGFAQRSSHKPRITDGQTDGWTLSNVLYPLVRNQ